jgi:hypothetical protein
MLKDFLPNLSHFLIIRRPAMKSAPIFAGVLLVALFAAGVTYLLFFAPELCVQDAAPKITNRGSQHMILSHGRITVLSVTGDSINCMQNGRKVTFVVENLLKRGQLQPGKSCEVDYAATRYPNGVEVRVISRIYRVVK